MRVIRFGSIATVAIACAPISAATPYQAHPAYTAYEAANERDDLAGSLALLRDVAVDFPDDANLELELGILILRQPGAEFDQCKAVEHLERSISLGMSYVAIDVLNLLYAGQWALAATMEGSDVAKKHLDQRIAEARYRMGEMMEIDPEKLRSLESDRLVLGSEALPCPRGR